MKAIDLLKEWNVNPKDFMVVLVDSQNIHVLLDGDIVPEDDRLIAFAPLSKRNIRRNNEISASNSIF